MSRNSSNHNKSLDLSPMKVNYLMDDSQKKREVTLPSINPESSREDLNERTLKKLIQINREYLKDKVKVGDVRKPSRYAYRLPSKTGSSEYNRIFARSLPSNDLSQTTPNRSRIANNIKLPNKQITNYQSTYSLEFSRRKEEQLLKKMQKHKPDTYERKQGPFFTQTCYNRDYVTHSHSPPAEEIKHSSHIALGGKFNDETTYKQYFQTKETGQQSRPIIHKDHSIFVKIGKPRATNYQQSYLKASKPQKVEESCKPTHKLGTIMNKIKYRTEYSDKYVQQTPNEKREFQCLNSDQLKNYVLKILNNH